MFVVEVDNVGSQQMNQTRKQMRGTAEILMGKNTLMRKVLKDFLIDNPEHFYANIECKMAGNVGFVFTNSDLPKVLSSLVSSSNTKPSGGSYLHHISQNGTFPSEYSRFVT